MGNVVTIRRVGDTVTAFETSAVGFDTFVRILGFYESEEAALAAWPSGVVQDAGEFVRG